MLDGALRVITSQAEKFVKEERMGREHSGEAGEQLGGTRGSLAQNLRASIRMAEVSRWNSFPFTAPFTAPEGPCEASSSGASHGAQPESLFQTGRSRAP